MKSKIIYKLIAQLKVLILLTFTSGATLACDDVKGDSETAKTHIQLEQAQVNIVSQHYSTHDDCNCCESRCCYAGCYCAYSKFSYVYVTPINNYYSSFKLSENIVTKFSQYSFPNSPPLLRPPIS